VQLRFDIARSPSLTEAVRQRLLRLAGNRVTTEGVLIIDSGRHRSQDKNRQAAVDRLVALIRKAARPPKKRKKTKPSRSAKNRRLEKKRRRSEKKRLRRKVRPPRDYD
jgi:ribosome-associated protein